MSKLKNIFTRNSDRDFRLFQNNAPEYIKKILKYALTGFTLYLLFIAGFAIFNNIWLSDLGIGWLQKTGEPSDFAISFFASSMESILFFVCSGAIAFFLSISRPEHEDFDTKLSYLFPRVNQTEKGKEYCRSSVNKLACISTKTTVQVSVDEYSPKYEAFKVSTEHVYHLLNLHNNVHFKDELKITHKLDNAEPTSFGTHSWGQIKKIRTISGHKRPEECLNALDSPVQLTTQEYTLPFEVKIKPNDHLILDISSWTWNNFLSPQTSRVGRFTEHLDMKVTNSIDQTIVLIKHNEGDNDNQVEILPGDTYLLHSGVSIPSEAISYTIELKPEEQDDIS
ncbi:hypothetical protein PZ937_21300 [Vibrio alginolyticus]|uniref:hypothetical protein n=1 Tax=Vibrio chagasii TaxID=170679 RepID=UPI001EFC63F0|nr:hypothetical protein [Vibrio chagasii]MDE9383326.1 hypothetical protein [Vibrio alginolyticus]MCG9607562.1 hypothetical protein [Vibrio chagasii]CAH6863118.1 hypothetical protein VCHA34P117_230056 [Vibrio chagasii]CAH6990163.1 hypothetical protein VCHA39P226_160066 [Vibrio chagasii]CAH7013762.1 hypothetical protein VCHA52P453_170022 [Vibrio chagasii]